MKNFLDALQGKHMCWVNDAQVREIFAIVVPSASPRTAAVLYHISQDYLAEREI